MKVERYFLLYENNFYWTIIFAKFIFELQFFYMVSFWLNFLIEFGALYCFGLHTIFKPAEDNIYIIYTLAIIKHLVHHNTINNSIMFVPLFLKNILKGLNFLGWCKIIILFNIQRLLLKMFCQLIIKMRI